MVFNEKFFLPIWLSHYGRLFGDENCFVIDDGSDDGSVEESRIFNLISKKRSFLDEEDRAMIVSYFHAELLKYYDCVIYTDTDELIVIDPRVGMSLMDYLSIQSFSHKTPIGFDVLQRTSQETTIDRGLNLFEQRQYVRFSYGYCKTLVSTQPILWGAGFHYSNVPPAYDGNLYLFHLRGIDYSYSRERILQLNQIRFSESALKAQHGVHFRWNESKYLEHLYGTPDAIFENALQGELLDNIGAFELDPSVVAAIPERFRNVIALSGPAAQVGHVASERKFCREQLIGFFENAIHSTLRHNPDRSRNDLCPCGSGLRRKHCHEALI